MKTKTVSGTVLIFPLQILLCRSRVASQKEKKDMKRQSLSSPLFLNFVDHATQKGLAFSRIFCILIRTAKMCIKYDARFNGIY